MEKPNEQTQLVINVADDESQLIDSLEALRSAVTIFKPSYGLQKTDITIAPRVFVEYHDLKNLGLQREPDKELVQFFKDLQETNPEQYQLETSRLIEKLKKNKNKITSQTINTKQSFERFKEEILTKQTYTKSLINNSCLYGLIVFGMLIGGVVGINFSTFLC